MTIGILFVCTGNICRSPTAEGVFRSMARQAELGSAFTIDSAGTYDGHVGQPPSTPAIAAAARRGYDIADLRARQVETADIARFDYVLAMDRVNLAKLRRLAPRAFSDRPQLFTRYGPLASVVDVADPYGGTERDYEYALDLIEAGCTGLLQVLAPSAKAAISGPGRQSG